MGVVDNVMGFVGGVVKYGFWSGVVLIGAAGAFAYNTKPTEESFQQYLRDNVRQSIKPEVPGIVSTIAAAIATSPAVMVTKVDDFVLVKVGRADDNLYIGAFHNWVPWSNPNRDTSFSFSFGSPR